MKCENAPWMRVSDLIGLAVPVSAGGQAGQRVGDQPGAEAVAHQMDPRRAGQSGQQWAETVLADDASAVLHFVVGHRAQQFACARPELGEGVGQPCASPSWAGASVAA